jgi:hypothetical protein
MRPSKENDDMKSKGKRKHCRNVQIAKKYSKHNQPNNMNPSPVYL